MNRRDFLIAAMGTISAAAAPRSLLAKLQEEAAAQPFFDPASCATYATPRHAMAAARETIAFVTTVNTGAEPRRPDYLACVDVDPKSPSYSRVVHRVHMPRIGDELHHFGWNTCSSCHGEPGKVRRYLVVPGLVSGNIHIIDLLGASAPKLHKVIEGKEIAHKTDLSAPHTVHCAPDGSVMISMLGDAEGNAPGGFLLLDRNFDVKGRWEKSTLGMNFNYDFWYQPRLNVMISTEWAAPNTVKKGFDLEDVKAGKYGRSIHFWDWSARTRVQTVDLGSDGLIPLEARFHHEPASPHGFVGAALGSSIWHFHKAGDAWTADKVVQVEPVEAEGWPFPVPGLITDLVLSMDDRYLYFSNWLHGDIRQYDVGDPDKPRLAGRIWIGGVLGKGMTRGEKKLAGGPQMLQLSLDGKRLYVTSSLYSPWDDQFYPDIAKQGSFMLQVDCDTEQGGLTLNEDFFVDFGAEPNGPVRAHEMRFPGGDCTSDIWV